MKPIIIVLFVGQVLFGQQPKSVEQEAHGGQCNNIVAQGSVTLNCTGLNEAEAKLLLSLSRRILDEIKSQNHIDVAALYARLDQCASLASEAHSSALEARNAVLDVQKYSYVATLTFNGSPYPPGSDIAQTTPISVSIEGTWRKLSTGGFRPVCAQPALDKNRVAISKFPDYPFTYYSLAYCLEKESDPSWRSYAERAAEIFEKTTTISGHQGSHDELLAYLRQLLASK